MKSRNDGLRESATRIDRDMGMGTANSRIRRQIPAPSEKTLWSLVSSNVIGNTGTTMFNQCANPSCGKPLHYLREGRIFVFDLPVPDLTVPSPGGRARRLQHFWLCGPCSETMVLEQTSEMQIRVAMKSRKVETGKAEILPGSLAL
jgi:hypothetical protein